MTVPHPPIGVGTRRAVWGAAVAGLLGTVATACSGPHGRVADPNQATVPAEQTTTTATTPAPTSTAATTSTTRPPPPTTIMPAPPPEQPGWTPVSEVGGHIAVDERTYRAPDGSAVTIARFRAGATRFDLHVGSEDPPTGGAALPPTAGSAVSPAEAPRLLAAFNGGFKVASGTGGFLIDNVVLRPLTTGTASFVIDTNGTGHVGVWGAGLPGPGERTLSVRQNLPPLVSRSQPSPLASSVAAWGATLGGVAQVARSALGQDPEGNILYAGSMSALPADMADALIATGATTAMELDINPEWVQLDVAARPGAPLSAGLPGQDRPANQYLAGWTRDFITVLTPPAP